MHAWARECGGTQVAAGGTAMPCTCFSIDVSVSMFWYRCFGIDVGYRCFGIDVLVSMLWYRCFGIDVLVSMLGIDVLVSVFWGPESLGRLAELDVAFGNQLECVGLLLRDTSSLPVHLAKTKKGASRA